MTNTPKAPDSSIREAIIEAMREYRRSLKRLMNIQHRALKPITRKKQ